MSEKKRPCTFLFAGCKMYNDTKEIVNCDHIKFTDEREKEFKYLPPEINPKKYPYVSLFFDLWNEYDLDRWIACHPEEFEKQYEVALEDLKNNTFVSTSKGCPDCITVQHGLDSAINALMKRILMLEHNDQDNETKGEIAALQREIFELSDQKERWIEQNNKQTEEAKKKYEKTSDEELINMSVDVNDSTRYNELKRRGYNYDHANREWTKEKIDDFEEVKIDIKDVSSKKKMLSIINNWCYNLECKYGLDFVKAVSDKLVQYIENRRNKKSDFLTKSNEERTRYLLCLEDNNIVKQKDILGYGSLKACYTEDYANHHNTYIIDGKHYLMTKLIYGSYVHVENTVPNPKPKELSDDELFSLLKKK